MRRTAKALLRRTMAFFAASVVLLSLLHDKSQAESPSKLSIPVHTVREDPDSSGIIMGVMDMSGDQIQKRLSAYQHDVNGGWHQPQSNETTFARLSLKFGEQDIQLDVDFRVDQLPSIAVNRVYLESVVSSAATGGAVPESPGDQRVTTRSALESDDPVTEVSTYQRDNTTTKLARFMANTGPEKPDIDELNWMLDQYRPGPLWLLTRSPLVTEFSVREPLFAHFDLNQDGILDAEEVDAIAEVIKSADRDGNDSTSLGEMKRRSKSLPPTFRAPPNAFDWAWESPDVLERVPADCKITFQIKTPSRAGDLLDAAKKLVGMQGKNDAFLGELAVTATSTRVDLQNTQRRMSVVDTPWRIAVHGFADPSLPKSCEMQCSIAGSFRTDQIWDQMDTDRDGQIGLLERSKLADKIRELDTNGDGQILAMEIPVVLDIVLCQGSGAKEQMERMATQSTATQSIAVPTQQKPAPPWFASMDQNGDRVVSRDEFLGSEEQFSKLDQDNSGWIDLYETD